MPRAKIYANAAERQAAYRARNKLVTLTVEIPQEVMEAFQEYLRFKDKTKNEVITKLLTDQLLRKR
jgi:hypothetical protein